MENAAQTPATPPPIVAPQASNPSSNSINKSEGGGLSKRTLALIAFLVVLAGLLTYIAVSQKSYKQTTPIPPSPKPTVSITPQVVGHSTLSLLPNPLIVSSGSASVDVMINPNGDKVTAVQVELSFDPTVLTPTSIDQGNFFSSPFVLLKNMDQKNGKISYALALSPSGTPNITEGKVATINFTVKLNAATKESKIEVLPKSLVTAEGIYQSVLVNSSGTTVVIK